MGNFRQSSVRFPVEPADIPPEKAARRLHLTLDKFNAVLPQLLRRGFPACDPDTQMYDLEAIDRWRRLRNRRFFPELTIGEEMINPAAPAVASMEERFRAAKERTRHG